MFTAQDTLDAAHLEMRWRALSLAADLDRIERLPGGAALLKESPSMKKLNRALRVVLEGQGNRAEQVQMIFSDLSLPPGRGR